jgi:hypothetical protein
MQRQARWRTSAVTYVVAWHPALPRDQHRRIPGAGPRSDMCGGCGRRRGSLQPRTVPGDAAESSPEAKTDSNGKRVFRGKHRYV